MNVTTFTFADNEGRDIFVYKWTPPRNEIVGVVQIAHGMAEHAARYERFAEYLTGLGFAVYANDHRGHGRTAEKSGQRGIYADRNGFDQVVANMHQLTEIIRNENSGKKIYLFGHSMGSMLSQGYIVRYGRELAGCILCGTAGPGGCLISVANRVGKIVSMVKGRQATSDLLDTMSFGSYNKAFAPNRTEYDWLSRDTLEVDRYIDDPWCGFSCSAGLFVDLTDGLKWVHHKKTIKQISKELPVLFIAGSEDPVGSKTKSIQSLIDIYQKNGMADVNWTFYPGARHEILNETNRLQVMADVGRWLQERQAR